MSITLYKFYNLKYRIVLLWRNQACVAKNIYGCKTFKEQSHKVQNLWFLFELLNFVDIKTFTTLRPIEFFPRRRVSMWDWHTREIRVEFAAEAAITSQFGISTAARIKMFIRHRRQFPKQAPASASTLSASSIDSAAEIRPETKIQIQLSGSLFRHTTFQRC